MEGPQRALAQHAVFVHRERPFHADALEWKRRGLPQKRRELGDFTPDLLRRRVLKVEMGAEDAAFLLENVSGCFFFVGSANKERDLHYGHHHPRFDFDEEALVRGTALMAAAAFDLLTK